MKLNIESLQHRDPWIDAGFELPTFDLAHAKHATTESPRWIHFGAGNIFRAFPAAALQTLMNTGDIQSGVIACEGFDGDIIDLAYRPFDNLSVLAVLRGDGNVDKKVIASVMESLRLDRIEDLTLLRKLFIAPTLQMVSFTITEKGYATRGSDGQPLPFIQQDIQQGPDEATSTIGRLTALLMRRYEAGAHPLALVSMDNCSHNGDMLRRAVLTVAEGWQANGFADQSFYDYLTDGTKMSFPWTMIDKITPRPDAKVARLLADSGFEDTQTIVTARNTYTAAFVNAEETEYLVIEDDFPNGRPPLEKAGIYFTDRDTVNRVEKMKVCTCLNPLHTALAILGCLMGYKTIYSEMRDKSLRTLVERIAYVEGMPVVVDPLILSPMEFAKRTIEQRLSNPFMPDAPERIATDTSQKLSIRFGETIKAYLRSDSLSVDSLKCIPFVLAAWIRYLMGVNDELAPFDLSPDPMLDELKRYVDAVVASGAEACMPLLCRADVFGVDLVEAGLSDKVVTWLCKMLEGKGAVRRALDELVM